jgi:glycosyltransferase involved in cell wall biosynthesis
MATYNGEEFLKEAIDSVLKQTYRDFEFIIIDDGSTDGTASIIQSFDDARIVYLKKETNSGIADSLNLGIARAKGRFIARMDDDDVCMPTRFEAQLQVFEQHEDVILCATAIVGHKKTQHRFEESSHELFSMELLFKNPIVHPTVMIQTKALLKHLYNPAKVPSEDYDLWSRLIWEGRFYKIHTPLLLYRSHKKSETTKRRKEQLVLNVAIAEAMYATLGFTAWLKPNNYIKILASHDYSISGKQLRQLITWLDQLKAVNEEAEIFSKDMFRVIIDQHLSAYLTSYFMNQKLRYKLLPFLHLSLSYKWFILSYYFNKWLN